MGEPAPEHPHGLTFECRIHFRNGSRGKKRLQEGVPPPPPPVVERVPHVVCLLAMAHRFEGLLNSGEVKTIADLARISGITHTHVGRILRLLFLAPDIQEEILDLPPVTGGREAVTERALRPLVATPYWDRQRVLWRQLLKRERQGKESPSGVIA